MADKVTTEELQLRVLIDGSPARKELAELDQEAAKIKASLRDMKKGTEEYIAATKRLDEIAPKQAKLRKEIGDTALTTRQLKDEMRRLQIQQDNTMRDTPEWVTRQARITQIKKLLRESTNEAAINERAWEKLRKEFRLVDMSMEQLEAEYRRLKLASSKLSPTKDAAELAAYGRQLSDVDKRMAYLRSGMGPFAKLWSDIKVNVLSAGAVIGGMLAGGAIVTGIQNLVTGSAKLSDELANVRKVTGLTEVEVRKLNTQFGQIDTRTSTSNLRGIAVGLGQIGEAADAVNVEALDKIVVALQDEFGLDPTQITTALSVLRNNLSDLKTANYDEDVLHIGNALNKLGAEGLATAPVITDIATRIAGVARTFGVTSGEIFGLAATFQELGINTERGSTAYVKTIQRMTAAPAEFAAVVRAAGGDVKQFAIDLNNDTQAAFVTFVRSAQKAGTTNTAFAKILKDLDVDGAGISELVSKIGQNYELLAEKTTLATRALTENDSILEEFTIKNNNLAGELAKLGKEFARLFVNDTMIRWVNSAVTGMREVVDWVRRSKDEIALIAGVVGRVAVAWGTYRVTIAAVNTLSRVGAFLTRAWAVAQGVLAGTISVATAATTAFNTAIKLNPIGLIVSAIATAITFFIDFGEEVTALTEKQRAYNETLEETKRIATGIANINERVDTKEVLTVDQLQSLRRDIQQQIQEQSDLQAGAIAAEKKFSRDIEAVRQNRVERIATLEEEAATAENRLQGLDAELLLDVEKSMATERERIRAASGKAITAEEAAENQKRLEAQLAAVDAELKKRPKVKKPGAGLGDDDSPDAKKAVAEMEKAAAEIDAIRERMLQARLTDDEAELRQLDVKHAEERAKVVANANSTAEDLKALDDLHANERANLIGVQGQKRIDAHAAVEKMIVDAIATSKTARLQEELAYWDKLIKTATAQGKSTVELEAQRRNAMLRLIEQEKEDALRNEIEMWDGRIAIARANGIDTTQIEEERRRALAAINAKYNQQEVDDTEDAEEKKRQARISTLEAFAAGATAVGNILQGMAALSEEGVKEGEERSEREKKSQRSWALAVIGAQTAAAIATGVAQAQKAGPPMSYAIALATVGQVLALMAQAKAIMRSANSDTSSVPSPQASGSAGDVPLGADGALTMGANVKTAKGAMEAGILEGPRHSAGGLKVVNPQNGKVVAEFEGGEAYMLFSKRFTDNNRALLPHLLEASRKGDRVNFMNGPVQDITPQVGRAMEIVHFAGGGVISNRNSTIKFTKGQGAADGSGHQNSTVRFRKGTGFAEGGGGGETPPWAEQIINLLAQQNALVRQDMATPRPAEIVTSSSMDRNLSNWERLKDNNKLRRA